jgi:hypothetical protein
MKTWLLKLKISNAINDRQPLPPSVESAVSRSAELQSFVADANALARELKNQLPCSETSAQLHASIMRAVRSARSVPDTKTESVWPRWVPASGLVAAILLGVVLIVQFMPQPAGKVQPADAHPLADASSALDLGGSLMSQAPELALSPLSDEMQKLDRNLADTGKFLLASLP